MNAYLSFDEAVEFATAWGGKTHVFTRANGAYDWCVLPHATDVYVILGAAK